MNAAVDAAIALLLISAAVGVVVTADRSPAASPTTDRADAVADTLAATTAAINYSLAPGVRELNRSEGVPDRAVRPDTPGLDRTAHGSLAGLLARAATATSGVVAADADADPEEVPLTRTRAGFERAVRDAVRARTGAGVRVDARWRPYPDAPVGGRVGVGPAPPSDGVHTATLVVPTGVEPIPTTPTTNFAWLGRAVASRSVNVLVAPGPARITLRGDDPEAALLAHRYARLAARTNTSVAEPLATEDTAAANARIADALAERMAADLRSNYERPSDAADAISVSSVRIVVSVWNGPEGGG
jgi:hypothetical protein